MDTDLRACAVCGRVLNHVSGTDDHYEHTLADGTDHPPVPVPPSEIPEQFRPRCDFCRSEFPTFVLPVHSFVMPAISGHGSEGDWAACSDCASLLSRNEWNALVRRVESEWVHNHGEAMSPLIVDSLRALYRTLRKNVSGAVRPLTG